MANLTPEQKMAAIFQEVGLQRFQQMTKLIVALNTPKRVRKPREVSGETYARANNKAAS